MSSPTMHSPELAAQSLLIPELLPKGFLPTIDLQSGDSHTLVEESQIKEEVQESAMDIDTQKAVVDFGLGLDIDMDDRPKPDEFVDVDQSIMDIEAFLERDIDVFMPSDVTTGSAIPSAFSIGLKFSPKLGKSISTIYRADGSTVKIREELTPVAKHIRETILSTGPISIAQYMQLALTSPVGGYYTRGQVFGRSGDFVTSPEISQMFGEVMAVWYVLHWEMMGRPAKTRFVELGPGRGTLMDDMLRAARRFPQFFATIQGVDFVERSPELRKMQLEKLGCMRESMQPVEDKNEPDTPASAVSEKYGGISVRWHTVLEEVSVDADCVPLVMAHEFFDALPIYKFEKGAGGWSEILVDLDDSDSSATTATTSAKLASSPHSSLSDGTDACHFKFVRSRQVTSNAAAILSDQQFSSRFDKGDHIEVSPDSARVMSVLADWVSQNSGMALIVDYGQDWTQGDTFRGIRKHKFANPLSQPGSMDLTADVDFSYLRMAAQGKARCFGPVEQGKFLHDMGIQARLKQLLQTTKDTKVQQDLVDCYKRLTDPNSMGRIYKVLAVLPNSAQGAPVPFTLPTKEELNRPKVEKIVK
ncbi:hypothetical protein EC988_001747 [Linderina pennispora]|nr:hypothetical protein EC988_001747 [Linderina pennispora]